MNPTPIYDAILTERLLAPIDFDQVAEDWQRETGGCHDRP